MAISFSSSRSTNEQRAKRKQQVLQQMSEARSWREQLNIMACCLLFARASSSSFLLEVVGDLEDSGARRYWGARGDRGSYLVVSTLRVIDLLRNSEKIRRKKTSRRDVAKSQAEKEPQAGAQSRPRMVPLRMELKNAVTVLSHLAVFQSASCRETIICCSSSRRRAGHLGETTERR